MEGENNDRKDHVGREEETTKSEISAETGEDKHKTDDKRTEESSLDTC